MTKYLDQLKKGRIFFYVVFIATMTSCSKSDISLDELDKKFNIYISRLSDKEIQKNTQKQDCKLWESRDLAKVQSFVFWNFHPIRIHTVFLI